MTLADLDNLYAAAGRLNVTRAIVSDASVDEFTLATRELEKFLGPEGGEEPWLTGLAPMRKARWLLHTVPLPPAHPALGLSELGERLARTGRLLASGGSEELKHWVETAALGLELLAAEEQSSFVDAACEALRDGADTAATVVLLNASMVQPVQDFLAGKRVPLGSVLTAPALRRHAPHESQLVVGASRHFPDWIFTAPRAEIITVLHRASTTDRAEVPSALPVGGQPTVQIRGDRQSRLIADAFVVEPPPIDWSSLRSEGDASPRDDDVKARAYLLADSHSVLLEASEGATAFIVDADGRAGEVIGKVPTSAVEVGHFLLLRESFGDEDVIVQLANKILGKRASTLRGQQEHWKQALRTAVARDGIAEAYKQLEAHGCQAKNLNRWLGPDAIRTQSPTDFRAICLYGGLAESVATHLWTAMSEIASAHIKAGHAMRELLEKQLTQMDLAPLHSQGRLTVNVPELDAGTLGIFRVEAKDEGVCMVNPRELRVAVKVRRP